MPLILLYCRTFCKKKKEKKEKKKEKKREKRQERNLSAVWTNEVHGATRPPTLSGREMWSGSCPASGVSDSRPSRLWAGSVIRGGPAGPWILVSTTTTASGLFLFIFIFIFIFISIFCYSVPRQGNPIHSIDFLPFPFFPTGLIITEKGNLSPLLH